MKEKGWIKLHRNIKDWEYYDDINATRLLIHLLVSVNHETKKWKGLTIKPGSMIFSWQTLASQSGLTIQETRTAMSKLERSNEVTRSSTNKYQLVTLIKWGKFQYKKEESTDSLTDNQQAANNQLTTTKEDIRNKESIYIEETEFLEDWKVIREHYLNKPTNIKKLTTEELTNFDALRGEFTKEDFRNAMQGVFNQKEFYESARLRPGHFLRDRNIEKYLDAYKNKTQLFAKKKAML